MAMTMYSLSAVSYQILVVVDKVNKLHLSLKANRTVVYYSRFSFSFRLSVRVAGCCRFPLRGCRAKSSSSNGHRHTLDELPG